MRQDGEISTKGAGFESKSTALVGRRVLAVRYWDVHNFTGEPRAWDYGDWHHAVMGVELLTDRGPSCILWTGMFFCYGVEVFHSPMTDHLVMGEDGPESWAADGSGRWSGRLGSPITAVETFWERIAVGPAYRRDVRVADPYEVDVPVALRIDFAAGPVWMAAAMPPEPGMQQAFVGGDEIMVVFTADRMRQIGLPESALLLPAGGSRHGPGA